MKTKSVLQNSRPKATMKLLMAAALGVLFGITAGSAAVFTTPWTGNGPGTISVLSDGSTRHPQFSYFLSGDAVFSDQTWDFHTTADADGTVTLPYCWQGFHAFFQVTTHLVAYVTHADSTTTSTILVQDGPVDCCTPPSAGFHYTGTATFTVLAGETYGFQFGGSNQDSDSRLLGTVTVGDNAPPSCDAGGPYSINAGPTPSSIQLNATGSSDADGDPLTYFWTTDCSNATFDDPTSPTPMLTIGSASSSGQCMVTLTVNDGCDSSSCSATVDITVAPANKCPLGLGYWKTHTNLWPVASLTLGTVTYTKDQLIAILNSPVTTDASIILAKQLLAALLNIANGSDPSPISSTIADADALLDGCTVPCGVSKKTQPSTFNLMVHDAGVLESYNVGTLTPGCTP